MQDREAQAQKHTRIARNFLESADGFFEQGDFVQTSEKLWGRPVTPLKSSASGGVGAIASTAIFGRPSAGWLKKPGMNPLWTAT